MDALAYGHRTECLLHIARYFFTADKIGEFQAIYKIKSILDAACGLGYGTEILKRNHPDKEVIGLDHDEAAIAHCQALYTTGFGIKYICLDIMEAPAADAITSLETIEHIVDWQAAFAHLQRKSKLLIFSTPWKELATVAGKQFHRAFGLYDESFTDLIAPDRVVDWYCQRRLDARILPLEEVVEEHRSFLLGVVRIKKEAKDAK